MLNRGGGWINTVRHIQYNLSINVSYSTNQKNHKFGNVNDRRHNNVNQMNRPVHHVKSPNVHLSDPESMKETLSHDGMSMKRILPTQAVPNLSYGLERVLFNPGVHWLRDIRTNLYNFDPFLRDVPSPDTFNFNSVPEFIPASKDESLQKMATDENCSFVTSTSSISQSMSSIFFVLMQMKPLNLENLSQVFNEEPNSYTVLTRSPTSVLLKPHGKGLRSIVVEKFDEEDNVLTSIGQILERMLTEPKGNFVRMLKSSTELPLIRDSEAYAYTVAGNILLRSQLDCVDSRLPKKSFDLKTRASLPIRMDIQNYHLYRDYKIVQNNGLYGSFEREYYDMCRSALLKYNFQVRIGDMDGIFVAYHNTAEMFGFQYINREEMDQRIYGNSATGDGAFSLILQIYNQLLKTIVPLYPKETIVRLTFSPEKNGDRLTVYSDDAGMDGTMEGQNLKQFTLSLSSKINGFRTSSLVLDPTGKDKWSVQYNLLMMKTNTDQYESIRRRVTNRGAIREEEDGRSGVLMRKIRESCFSLPKPRQDIPITVAPWALNF